MRGIPFREEWAQTVFMKYILFRVDWIQKNSTASQKYECNKLKVKCISMASIVKSRKNTNLTWGYS